MTDLSHCVKGPREVKRIPVHRGELIYGAQVDDEDYEFLSKYRWRASVRSGTLTYANATVFTDIGPKSVEMRRMVISDAEETWNDTLGGWPTEVRLGNGMTVFIVPRKYCRLRRMSVDQIGGNGLNNTRANLRQVTKSEQSKKRRFD